MDTGSCPRRHDLSRWTRVRDRARGDGVNRPGARPRRCAVPGARRGEAALRDACWAHRGDDAEFGVRGERAARGRRDGVRRLLIRTRAIGGATQDRRSLSRAIAIAAAVLHLHRLYVIAPCCGREKGMLIWLLQTFSRLRWRP